MWNEKLLEHLSRPEVRGVTPEEAVAIVGQPPGRQTPEERLENLEKNGRLRRKREAGRVRYILAPHAGPVDRPPTFAGWGRDGPKVSSVFELAGRFAR